MKRLRLEPGTAVTTALLAAGHIAAWTLLGVVVHQDVMNADTTAAAPVIPLHQPDVPPPIAALGTE